ncbi:DNA primase [Koleobacter methoxysyntrophicus]|uniref:DNA primase n=1 Tax=Koleobacter methoxysyntrophicus TaxID=2751313 RepID=A0A8A0RRF7_9FIRM|nr:CHC2 zinc finger domain-containing protein [Koleobacter methoxysyntrophicus]QSQ09776.1 DNA primase [Koleobacter methoxysyntrophicus]
MKIKIMIDNIKYNNKPQGKEIGSIVKRLSNNKNITKLSVEELANKIIEGYTVKPAICGRKQKEWQEQQVFMIDIDKGLTIEKAIERSREINIIPAFIYTSFSHTEDNHKFRLVFISDEVITNINEALAIQHVLNSLFSADEHCKNLNRIYFGGRSIVYESYSSVINVREILNKYSDIWYNERLGKKSDYNNRYKNNIYYLSRKNPYKQTNDNNNIKYINISCTKKPHNNNKYNNNISINIVGEKTLDDYYNIKAIKDKNIQYLKSVLNVKKEIILQNEQELYDYIKKEINLIELLNIDNFNNFRCIIHNDNNPSAGIIQDDDGTYIYHCFGCGFKGNIIHVVQALTNEKTYKVIEFIKEIYNIKVKKTDWQKEQIAILEANKQMLLNGDFEKYYPNVYKLIKRYIPQLITMIDIAIMNVRDENFTDNEGNIVFFISNSELANLLNSKSNKRINQRNVLFAFLKLLKKLDKDEIPEKDLKKALEIQKKYKHNNIVNYFSIGDYDIYRMKESEKRATMWYAKNMSMTGLSYEGIYRTFGKEIANELYPQYKKKVIKTEEGYKEIDRTTSKASDERTNDIIKIIFHLINSKRYATEKEVIEILQSKYGKILTQVQLKRSLQEILYIYNLKRIRCNKEIKEQLGITSKGYPFIIVKND